MKRILLVSFIGLILAGCGEDKVTKEYLVGEWSCNTTIYDAKYDQSVSRTESPTIFKLSDGKLYGSSGDDRFKFYDPDYIRNNPIHEYTVNQINYRVEQHYKKINNDTYTYTNTYTVGYEIKEKNNVKNIIDSRMTLDKICTRIK